MAERISVQPVKLLKTLKNVQTATAKIRGHLERFLILEKTVAKAQVEVRKIEF